MGIFRSRADWTDALEHPVIRHQQSIRWERDVRLDVRKKYEGDMWDTSKRTEREMRGNIKKICEIWKLQYWRGHCVSLSHPAPLRRKFPLQQTIQSFFLSKQSTSLISTKATVPSLSNLNNVKRKIFFHESTKLKRCRIKQKLQFFL